MGGKRYHPQLIEITFEKIGNRRAQRLTASAFHIAIGLGERMRCDVDVVICLKYGIVVYIRCGRCIDGGLSSCRTYGHKAAAVSPGSQINGIISISGNLDIMHGVQVGT